MWSTSTELRLRLSSFPYTDKPLSPTPQTTHSSLSLSLSLSLYLSIYLSIYHSLPLPQNISPGPETVQTENKIFTLSLSFLASTLLPTNSRFYLPTSILTTLVRPPHTHTHTCTLKQLISKTNNHINSIGRHL